MAKINTCGHKMGIKDFTVGQTAYFSDRRIRSKDGEPLREVTVTKIGRKYVTVKSGWQERQFEPAYTKRADRYLVEKVDIGTGGRLYKTREAYEEQRELESMRDWLHKAAGWDLVNEYTLEQLREVRSILER